MSSGCGLKGFTDQESEYTGPALGARPIFAQPRGAGARRVHAHHTRPRVRKASVRRELSRAGVGTGQHTGIVKCQRPGARCVRARCAPGSEGPNLVRGSVVLVTSRGCQTMYSQGRHRFRSTRTTGTQEHAPSEQSRDERRRPHVPCSSQQGREEDSSGRQSCRVSGDHPATYSRRGGPRARGSRGSRQGEQVTLNKRAGVQRCSGARVKAPKYALPRELEPVGRTQASSPLGAHAPATQRVGSMGQRGSLDARAMGADAPDVPTPGRRKAGLVLERQGASGPTR